MKRLLQSSWCILLQSLKGASLFLIVASLLVPCSYAILDTNSNGLSDLWEKEHNAGELFPETFDPQADYDKDGWTNAEEAAAGTDPYDPNPPDGLIRPATSHIPAVMGEENGIPVVITPEAVTVSWPTLAGKRYTLLFSPDLTEGSWLPVGSPFIASGGGVTYGFDVNDSDKRFWRVAVNDIDTDSDGLSDAEENALGLDPQNAHTLADMPDHWLAANFTAALLANDVEVFNPYADPDGDGVTNARERWLNTNPNNADDDGDGTVDGVDIRPKDDTASFVIGHAPRHALFPITNAEPTSESPAPMQISDRGTVLYSNGTWTAGTWTPLVEYAGGILSASARTINDSDTILGIAYDALNNTEQDDFQYACYWQSPGANPALVETGTLRAGFMDAESPANDLADKRLSPGPALANDGGFYFPASERNGDIWNFVRQSRWKLPSGGQSATEIQAASGLRYSTGTDLQWGFHPQAGDTIGYVLAPSALPALVFVPMNVASQPGGSVIAMQRPGNGERARAFVNGSWQEAIAYGQAIDIAADGTAIGKISETPTASVFINGRWNGINRTAPIEKGAFDPTPPWHDASVKLNDTTAGGWILAQREDFEPYENALMLPIRAEGYYQASDGTTILTEAVGVDDFSIGSDLPGNAVQDRIWIMAPQGTFNKIVKFKTPLNENTPLKLEAPNILFSGGTESDITISGQLNAVVLKAADNVLSGGERLMTMTLGTGDDEVLSVSQPVGLKIMKSRTVKVTVYKVTKLYGTSAEEEVDATIMPTQEELTDYLKDVYRPQVNVVFDMNLEPEPLEARWDDNNNGLFDIQTGVGVPGEEAEILAKLPANPPVSDLRVFIVANPAAPLGRNIDAYGLTPSGNRTCWIHGSIYGRNTTKPFLLQTIAHEIGHVLVGDGHPDLLNGPGCAPLPGTDHTRRLMCSGPSSTGHSNLLVKGEWDAAETWLKNRPRGDF